MRVFVYVVARDFGFAPNPFHGVCSLATCKPKIRNSAEVGDWIVGIGAAGNGTRGKIIYAMCVDEILTYNEYWCDERFQQKRPYLPGSLISRYGDNIYFQQPDRMWLQAESHHSLEGGRLNSENRDRDTSSQNVLLGKKYWYFGAECPQIPQKLRVFDSVNRGYKCNFPEEVVSDCVNFFETGYRQGCHGDPVDWPR